MAYLFDLTERRQAEQERDRLRAQFLQAQKMESIGRLASGVAHDFNNLLTVINGYSQMLLSKLSAGDPFQSNLLHIRKAGERAAGLTRQLLAYSRKQVLQPCRLDVNRVILEMQPMLERLVGEDVKMRVALGAASAAVHADPHQLEQVIMNLAVNARDAMPDGGRLRIETADIELDESYVRSHPEARVGRYVMLAVGDSGIGMDDATRQRIFEPFFTTKESGTGTGLGLSMVQGIVAQSEGWINVSSEPGEGATFKIYLPALSERAHAAGTPASVPAMGGRETVLVVEDQVEVREYAVKVLEEYGYRVIAAESGEQALLLWKQDHDRIHLILTDVVMPNMSGRELADRVQQIRPGIKVLFMSGYTDDVILRHGISEEAAQFIGKPFSPEELARRIRSVLHPLRRARVLVADDEDLVRGFLVAVLQEAGYEVIEAANGKEALERARAVPVDLAITDLFMPGQEGLATIGALRRDVPGVRIIAISGALGDQSLRSAQTLGADAVLSKPASAEVLLATVAGVLKLRT
jgi:CheY-like chemotaxis protein/nitrogen-specific signal transduction histidine kinase